MLSFTSQDHLITHAGCMDGALCAVVFLRFGGDKNHIHFSSPSHEKVDSLVLDVHKRLVDGTLYLADISVSEKTAELLDKHDNVRLYDHHKSAIPLDKYSWCTVDVPNSRCGSKVFYEACMKHRVYVQETPWRHLPALIDAVDDRDRWVNKHPQSKRLSELFSLLGQDAFIQRCMDYANPYLLPEEEHAVVFEEQRQNLYIERLKPIIKHLGNYKIGFVYCEQRFTSEAGHAMCEKHDLDCCVLVNMSAVSLRAPHNSPLDMSRIAKLYGGGGHKGAAGFQLSAILGDDVLQRVVKEFTIIHD